VQRDTDTGQQVHGQSASSQEEKRTNEAGRPASASRCGAPGAGLESGDLVVAWRTTWLAPVGVFVWRRAVARTPSDFGGRYIRCGPARHARVLLVPEDGGPELRWFARHRRSKRGSRHHDQRILLAATARFVGKKKARTTSLRAHGPS